MSTDLMPEYRVFIEQVCLYWDTVNVMHKMIDKGPL